MVKVMSTCLQGLREWQLLLAEGSAWLLLLLLQVVEELLLVLLLLLLCELVCGDIVWVIWYHLIASNAGHLRIGSKRIGRLVDEWLLLLTG